MRQARRRRLQISPGRSNRVYRSWSTRPLTSALYLAPCFPHAFTDLTPLVDALSLPSSWNSLARNCGLVITRSSRNPSVSKTSSYASRHQTSTFISPPSPQKKLKRKEYHTSAEFFKDVQLVVSNAMEFNSEGSQIHEDAQTLKVCSRSVSFLLPEPKPSVIVLFPSAHVRSPCVLLPP
jgi:hypothetical protein